MSKYSRYLQPRGEGPELEILPDHNDYDSDNNNNSVVKLLAAAGRAIRVGRVLRQNHRRRCVCVPLCACV